MRLDELPKVVGKRKKRIGRGYGSGKGGHTSSRGQKGQKARGKINPIFDGTKTKKSLIQRLPLLRGKGRLKPSSKKPFIVDLNDLNALKEGSIVNVETLIDSNVVPAQAMRNGVKVLGDGELKKKLTVAVPTTSSAAEKIKAVGGTVQ